MRTEPGPGSPRIIKPPMPKITGAAGQRPTGFRGAPQVNIPQFNPLVASLGSILNARLLESIQPQPEPYTGGVPFNMWGTAMRDVNRLFGTPFGRQLTSVASQTGAWGQDPNAELRGRWQQSQQQIKQVVDNPWFRTILTSLGSAARAAAPFAAPAAVLGGAFIGGPLLTQQINRRLGLPTTGTTSRVRWGR